MGDRTWTSIAFSGKLNAELAPTLVILLGQQACRSTEDDSTPSLSTLDHTWYDDECNYGQMDGVEGFCRAHGVSYLKSWNSGGGYGAGYLLYNAVVDQSFEVPGDDEPALGLSELTQLASEGKTLQDVVVYLQAISDFAKHYPPLELID